MTNQPNQNQDDPRGHAAEYVDGLAELLEHPQPPDDLRRLLADTARGLVANHTGGLATQLYLLQGQIAASLAREAPPPSVDLPIADLGIDYADVVEELLANPMTPTPIRERLTAEHERIATAAPPQ
jgi:hypothetical protein